MPILSWLDLVTCCKREDEYLFSVQGKVEAGDLSAKFTRFLLGRRHVNEK